MIRQELLASIIGIADEEDYSELNDEVKNAKESKEVTSLIKKICRASQRIKQKNHKHSGNAGRVA